MNWTHDNFSNREDSWRGAAPCSEAKIYVVFSGEQSFMGDASLEFVITMS